jgi:hypothetical protein
MKADTAVANSSTRAEDLICSDYADVIAIGEGFIEGVDSRCIHFVFRRCSEEEVTSVLNKFRGERYRSLLANIGELHITGGDNAGCNSGRLLKVCNNFYV